MGLKEAYQEKLEAQLREWTARLDQLKAKADLAEADAKIEYHRQIDGARSKIETAQTRLRELKSSSGEAWESLKDGIERAWADLKTAVEGAASAFK